MIINPASVAERNVMGSARSAKAAGLSKQGKQRNPHAMFVVKRIKGKNRLARWAYIREIFVLVEKLFFLSRKIVIKAAVKESAARTNLKESTGTSTAQKFAAAPIIFSSSPLLG